MNRAVKLEPDPTGGSYLSACSDQQHGNNMARSMSTASSENSSDLARLGLSRAASDSKVCRVCGDKALSINFNVVTCESCKAFFRRNALKPKEFRCPFNGVCEITMVSRKFCKKCRLRKCFDVGMMKEWIMTDEARLQKRQLIENNREKRKRVFADNTPPAKIRRKSSKIEIFDSPPATSSSMSSDELQLDTPSLYNGNKMTTDWVSNRPSGDNEMDQSGLLGSGTGNDSITIPKAVLLNLINRCQQNSQNACSKCPPPPVLTRALKLFEAGGLDGLEAMDDGLAAQELLSKCICSCACGARPPSNGSGEQAERPIESSNGAMSIKEEPGSVPGLAEIETSEVPHTSNSAFRPIDYNRSAAFPYMDNGSGQSSNTFDMSLITSASSAASTSAFLSVPSDPNLVNAHSMQELWKVRRALMHGLAAELGYGNADGHQQHTKFVITNPVEAIKTTQSYVQRMIEVNKMLSTFRSLTIEDQAALLQGGMRELTMLISATNYSHEADAWLPFGRNQPYMMKPEILRNLNADMINQHFSFIRSFAPQWSSDEVLMQMMAAICLFDPNRRGVVDREGVMRQRQFYYGLMKDYLVNLYGQQEGQKIFDELQSRLEWLRHGIDTMWPSYHLELSAQDLRPLMIDLLL